MSVIRKADGEKRVASRSRIKKICASLCAMLVEAKGNEAGFGTARTLLRCWIATGLIVDIAGEA